MRVVLPFVVIAILAISADSSELPGQGGQLPEQGSQLPGQGGQLPGQGGQLPGQGGQLPGQGGQLPVSGDQSCAPNGTPCNYKGIGGFTNCCTKFCLQFPEESMGRCANAES